MRKSATGLTLLEGGRKCNSGNAQPPDSTPHNGHVSKIVVLQCVADDMANRWLRGTTITTIRRKLYVGPARAEEIIRAGVLARLERKAAA